MSQENTESQLNLRQLARLFGIIFVLWAASGLMSWHIFPDWSTRGTFGDTFGFINSLFSGLALAGIIFTILLQRQELKYQREELNLTRLELKRAADAQEESNEALKIQSDLMKRSLIYQSFAQITNEYRDASMLQAVRELWRFSRRIDELGKDIAQEYLDIKQHGLAPVNADTFKKRQNDAEGVSCHREESTARTSNGKLLN